MDQALKTLERRALAGDTKALWKAYYMLKKTLPELSAKTLEQFLPELNAKGLESLRRSCDDQLEDKTFRVILGNHSPYSSIRFYDEEQISIKQLMLRYLTDPETQHRFSTRRKWAQTNPNPPHRFCHVDWEPGMPLEFYKARFEVRVAPKHKISGDEIPVAQYKYLVWVPWSATK